MPQVKIVCRLCGENCESVESWMAHLGECHQVLPTEYTVAGPPSLRIDLGELVT